MRIKVKLHPGSSQQKIVDLGRGSYEVWIKEKPIEGKANAFLEKFLKKEFSSKCKVVRGFTSRIKTIEVEDKE
jgi:uncharacterized protein (TIGR00251 family)